MGSEGIDVGELTEMPTQAVEEVDETTAEQSQDEVPEENTDTQVDE